MKVYLAVVIGGFFGSMLRYGIGLILPNIDYSSFPWATFFVNISGAFLLTYILFHPMIQSKLDQVVITGITTGLIGAYTTFSAITVEIIMLSKENFVLAIIYIFSTLLFGLFSSFLGYKFASRRVIE